LHVQSETVDGEPLPTEVGFLFGIGIVARFIAAYEQGGEPSPLKAAWTLARAVGSAFTGGAFAEAFFRGVPARVNGDGEAWPERAWKILTVGAVDQIGLGFRPTPGALTHPGSLHAFAAASSPVAFARDLVPLFQGRPTGDPLAHDQICRDLRIEADAPLTFNLDGDLFEVGPKLRVHTARPLRFVLGDPDAVDPARAVRPAEHGG
jgi:diacylglycerol kinase family enzyme